MSIHIMFRKCVYCYYKYNYNPSTGDFGLICPKCHKIQSKLVDMPVYEQIQL